MKHTKMYGKMFLVQAKEAIHCSKQMAVVFFYCPSFLQKVMISEGGGSRQKHFWWCDFCRISVGRKPPNRKSESVGLGYVSAEALYIKSVDVPFSPPPAPHLHIKHFAEMKKKNVC